MPARPVLSGIAFKWNFAPARHPLPPFVARNAAQRTKKFSERHTVKMLHCEFRSEVLRCCKQQDLKIQVTCPSQREDWIQGMVRDGVGVRCILRYLLLWPELDYRPIIDPALSRKVAFFYFRQAGLASILKMLIESIQVTVGQLLKQAKQLPPYIIVLRLRVGPKRVP